MRYATLNTGQQMPMFGLGTFKISGHETIYNLLDLALKLGYRLFDTAECYRNEKDIGDSLKELLPKHGLSREDVFIVSKLHPKNHGLDEAYATCLESLNKLGLDYLDLYLIHWPAKSKLKPQDPRHAGFRRDSWMAFEKLYREGKVKSIGVSNYLLQHLDEMASYASVQPAVLQVEHHPYLVQTDLLQWCKANDVFLQTYASLGTGKLLSEPLVIAIAERTGKSPSQVLLQWALQQDLGVIPKASNPTHLAENIDGVLLDDSGNWLKDEDIENLSNLHRGEKFCWDPSQVQ